MRVVGRAKKIEKVIRQTINQFLFEENNTYNRRLLVKTVEQDLKRAGLEDVGVRGESTCNNRYSLLRNELRVDVDFETKLDIQDHFRITLRSDGDITWTKIKQDCIIEDIQVSLPYHLIPGSSEEDFVDYLGVVQWKEERGQYTWKSYVPNSIQTLWNQLSRREKIIAFVLSDSKVNAEDWY